MIWWIASGNCAVSIYHQILHWTESRMISLVYCIGIYCRSMKALSCSLKKKPKSLLPFSLNGFLNILALWIRVCVLALLFLVIGPQSRIWQLSHTRVSQGPFRFLIWEPKFGLITSAGPSGRSWERCLPGPKPWTDGLLGMRLATLQTLSLSSRLVSHPPRQVKLALSQPWQLIDSFFEPDWGW